MIYLYILGFITTASFVSFLVAMDSRDWKNINSPSVCSCGARISPIALIPILGAIIYNFTCKECKTKFSKKMAISELLGGVLFILLSLNIDINTFFELRTLSLIMASSFFGAIIYQDLDSYTISDLYSLGAIFFLSLAYLENIIQMLYVIGGVYIFKMIFDNYLFLKTKDPEIQSMGEGDILIFGMLGLIANDYVSIINGFTIIPIIGIFIKFLFFNKKEYIPFVPAIVLGSGLIAGYHSILS